MRGNRRPLGALALVAIVALISACGSSTPAGTGTGSGSGNNTASHNSTGTTREKRVKFAECIRAHGVSDFPDPNAKGEFVYGVSVSPAVWIQATSACKALQPPGALSGKRTPKQQSTALKFAQCVRENG